MKGLSPTVSRWKTYPNVPRIDHLGLSYKPLRVNSKKRILLPVPPSSVHRFYSNRACLSLPRGLFRLTLTSKFHFFILDTSTMAKSLRELTGAPPSTASSSDPTLIIIDAQNEY